jgi:hypothetical protein
MFSASSLARDFSRDLATSRSLVRNSTIVRSSITADRPATPDEVFGSDRCLTRHFLGEVAEATPAKIEIELLTKSSHATLLLARSRCIAMAAIRGATKRGLEGTRLRLDRIQHSVSSVSCSLLVRAACAMALKKAYASTFVAPPVSTAPSRVMNLRKSPYGRPRDGSLRGAGNLDDLDRVAFVNGFPRVPIHLLGAS